MASPVDAGRATTNITAGSNSWSVNLPAGIASGNLLILLLRAQGTTTFTVSGWTQLATSTADGSGDRTSVYWRRADGTEGSTVTVGLSNSFKGAAIAYRITGAADPQITSAATGTNTAPDSPITSTLPAGDYLFLTLAGIEGEGTVTGSPSGYTNSVTASSGTGGAVASNLIVMAASRQATLAASTTENPPAWTVSTSDNWTAWTVIIPAAVAGNNFTRTPADTITLSDSIALKVGVRKADTITLSDATSRVWGALVSRADTITLSDLATKSTGIARADTLSLSDNMVAQIIRVLQLADTITLSDAVAKSARLARSDTVALSDQFARAWAAVRSLSDQVTMSDAVAKAIGATLADTISTSDTFGKTDVLARADQITLADAMARTYGLSRSNSIAMSDQIVRGLGLARADTITLGDALTRAAAISRADTITLSDQIDVDLTSGAGSGLTLNLVDTITLTDAVAKALSLSRADVIALADDLARAVNGRFQGSGDAIRCIFLGRFGIY